MCVISRVCLHKPVKVKKTFFFIQSMFSCIQTEVMLWIGYHLLIRCASVWNAAIMWNVKDFRALCAVDFTMISYCSPIYLTQWSILQIFASISQKWAWEVFKHSSLNYSFCSLHGKRTIFRSAAMLMSRFNIRQWSARGIAAMLFLARSASCVLFTPSHQHAVAGPG